MKKYQMYWVLLLAPLLLTTFSSCKRTYPELDTDNLLSIKTNYLKGNWVVSKVVQYDQEAIDNGFPVDVQSKDITTTYPFTDYKVTFNLDDAGKPTNYTITPGASPNYLSLNSGSWAVDNPVATTKITFFDNNITNNASFVVKTIEKDKLVLRVERRGSTDNTLFLFYEYTFVRQ